MTIRITSHGQTRVITDVEVVEEAFRQAGCDPKDLNPDFIPYWIKQGKSCDEILAIAGEQPQQRIA